MRTRLSAIESAANSASIPAHIVKELKSAVDHCRTALWAASLAAQDTKGHEANALILASRLQRVQEMCQRVQDDISNGRVRKETPGLGRFVATLGETERCVRSLIDQSAAGGGTP
jgi:hypothetical protein